MSLIERAQKIEAGYAENWKIPYLYHNKYLRENGEYL